MFACLYVCTETSSLLSRFEAFNRWLEDFCVLVFERVVSGRRVSIYQKNMQPPLPRCISGSTFLCNADKMHIYQNTRPHTPELLVWQKTYPLLSLQRSVNNLLQSPSISRNLTVLRVTLKKCFLYFLTVTRRIQECNLKVKRNWFPLNPFSQTMKMSYIPIIRNLGARGRWVPCYQEVHENKSWVGNRLSWLMFLIGFLSHSTQISK